MKASIYASVLQTVLMAAGVLAVIIKVKHFCLSRFATEHNMLKQVEIISL